MHLLAGDVLCYSDGNVDDVAFGAATFSFVGFDKSEPIAVVLTDVDVSEMILCWRGFYALMFFVLYEYSTANKCAIGLTEYIP